MGMVCRAHFQAKVAALVAAAAAVAAVVAVAFDQLP